MNPAEAVLPVTVRAARPADHAAIAAYVRAHPGGTPFHLPAWMEAVATGTGHRAHLLVAERGQALAGMLPLTEIRSLLFGRAMVSSGFAVGGGVIADDDHAADALARAGWALAETRKVPSLELRGGVLPAADNGFVRHEGAHAGFVRPLAVDDDAEMKAIPRKQRAELRKALAAGLEIATGRDDRAAAEHYAIYAESVRNLGTPVFPRKLFDAVRARFGEDADILTVRHDGRAVASVLSLYHNGIVMPYWGGGTWGARALRANELMYFALMRHARARGCVAFDFGRSKVDSGAHADKKNWGFDPAPLAYAVRTADGVAPREISPNDPRYAAKIAAWKKLPLWLANRLGPPLARGLG
jgi:FemAB-related protein (PEP-CTERM system-associated)